MVFAGQGRPYFGRATLCGELRLFLRFAKDFGRTLRIIEPGVGLCRMAVFFARLIRDECGVTAIEYALLLALIVIASLTAIDTLGLNLNLNRTFSIVAANL